MELIEVRTKAALQAFYDERDITELSDKIQILWSTMNVVAIRGDNEDLEYDLIALEETVLMGLWSAHLGVIG